MNFRERNSLIYKFTNQTAFIVLRTQWRENVPLPGLSTVTVRAASPMSEYSERMVVMRAGGGTCLISSAIVFSCEIIEGRPSKSKLVTLRAGDSHSWSCCSLLLVAVG